MPDQVTRLVRMPRNVPTSPRPVDGSQPSQTEKIMISIMPCQKFGRLKPRIEPVMMVSSSTVSGLRPDQRPSGMPRRATRNKSDEGEFQGRRHAVEDEIDGGLIEDEGAAEVAVQGVPQEGAILLDERLVESERPDRLLPFGEWSHPARSGCRWGCRSRRCRRRR